jgi:DNA-binding NarL/FixJ family response regulator
MYDVRRGSTTADRSYWQSYRQDSSVERLTPRQREVLALMAAGLSNAAIAVRLVISEKAVAQHTSQIYDRLDLLPDDRLHRRVLAVTRYLARAA